MWHSFYIGNNYLIYSEDQASTYHFQLEYVCSFQAFIFENSIVFLKDAYAPMGGNRVSNVDEYTIINSLIKNGIILPIYLYI